MATLAQITEAVYRARYEDQVTAGANAATRALQSNAQAAKENADAMKVVNNEVKATGPSISAVNAKLDENTRLARATAKANKEYEQTITALRREAERSTEAASRLAEMERRAGVLRDQQIAKARAAAEAMRQVYASSSGGGASASVDSISSSLASMAVRAAAVAISFQAVTNALRNMVTTADAAVSGAARIGVAVGNLEQGRAIYDQLALGAQKYGLSVTDAAAAFGRLSIAASQIGATNQQTLQLVETLQKLAVVSGTTATEAGSAIQQLGQALGSGRLQGDELRAILEAMPPLAAGLAAQLGVSIAQMRQMGAEGKLTSEVVFPAILRMTQGVNAQLAQMPVTVERATASLNQAWANLVVEVDRATGASSTLARWLQAASNSVQEMATRWRGASLAEEFKRVGDQLERIDRLERERNEPSLRATRNRGSIGTGAALAAQEQGAVTTPEMTAALREYHKELGLLLREESDMIANRQLLEQATAAARAEQARFATETERIKEAQESLGGASTKTREQIAALQSAVAAGDQSMARYGVTAGQAAAMLAALQGKADAALGVIQRLNQELQQGRADAISGFAGRLNARLVEAASQFGGDATQLDPVRVMQIGQQLAQLAEQQGQATLRQAQAETELARARASGNAMAEARVRAEQRHQERMGQGVTEATSLAQKEEELTQARLAGTSAAQGRLQPMAEVLRGLREEATQAANLARASGLSAQAQRVASEQDKARAEALKVARDRTAAYNVAYAQFLTLIQQTSRDQAVADVNQRKRAMEDEIALIERETQLIGELPMVREAEIAALRVRQEMLASSKSYTEDEIIAVQDLARARAQANVVQREAEASLSRIRSTSEEISRDVATMMFERLMDGKKGDDVVTWFRALFKRIAIQALSANIILPITTQIVGGMPGLFGISTGGASQAQIAAALAAQQQASGGGGLLGLGASYQAGQTLLSSYPGFSGYGNGLVGGGVGGVFNPGYNFNTGLGFADSALNTPVFGVGGSSGYGSMSQAALIDAGQAGMTYGQLGMGALGIAGGAYGVYSGLQTGGPKGYTQAASGAVGVAGGAAGLAVASGATAAGGVLAGGAMGTAIAATAAWAPYIAAALAIAAMFMKSGDPTNAAAGANINMTAGQVTLENSGKQTDATAGARDEMAKLVTTTVDRLSSVLGVRPSGYMGFELGQRDPSRVIYNGAEVGSASVGDQKGLADLIGKAIMMGFKDAPGLAPIEQRILEASGSNVDMAANLLQQTKAIKDTYGADALSPSRTYPTQALWSMAEKSGNIETMIGALKSAAELTAAYGDILGPINEVSKKAADIAWGSGSVDTLIEAFQGAAELTKAYGDALDPNANKTFRALFDASAATGDVKKFLAAMQGAAELTKAYGDALNGAEATHIVGMGGTDIAKIVGDLQWFFGVYKPLTDAAEQVSALDTALKASNKTYDDAITKARELGLAEDVLKQKREEAAENLRNQVRTQYDDLMRQAEGKGPVSESISAVMSARANITTNAKDYRSVGRDPDALFNAQLAAITKDLDFETLRDAAERLKGLDAVAATFFEAAAAAAEATQAANAAATYDAQLREATGAGWVNQIIDLSNVIAANAEAYRSAGKDPTELYAAQVKQIIDSLDTEALATAAQYLQGLDGVAQEFLEAAISAAQATAEANAAAAKAMAAANYDAQLREATGSGWVNQIINLSETVAANADAFRAAGRDPSALLAAQIQGVIDGLDTATLATAAANLQGLDSVTSEFVRAAIITAQATAAMANAAAQAAQRVADAADYDAKMRSAMGLELVNTIVAIRRQIDAMASRYIAAGRDPEALYAAQVSASLQGKSIDELASTAAALQGIDQAAAALATSALEQAIATEAQAAAAQAAEQAARDAEQAQQEAAAAAESAAREQEQAAQEAAQAAQQLAQAGQGIRDYINRLKSSPEAGYSPSQALANAQATYNSDLALAQSGDLDALGRITGSADALIEAAKGMYATGPQFVALRDQIIAQLNALPAVQSADQALLAAVNDVRGSVETSNTRLSSIGTGVTTTASNVSAVNDSVGTSNSLLASVDTNGDGVISQMEASVAAQNLIKEKAAENVTATGQVKDAVVVGNQTGYSDNELLNGIFGRLFDVQANIAYLRLDTQDVGAKVNEVRKYTGAAAINTMYGRPVAQEPGIGAISALGNVFDYGNVVPFARGGIPDMVSAPTLASMALFGEAGPEAIMPLSRGPDGRLGVSLWGAPSFDRVSNDNGAIERFERSMRQMQRASDRNMLALAQIIVAEQRRTTEAVRELKGPLKLALSA